MTALRILNLLIWGVMLAYMARGAIAAVTKHARYGDPMRLACSLTAIVFIAFNLFWMLGPGARLAAGLSSEPTMNALLVLSAALGAFILALGRTYGRGAPLNREHHDE